jgi:hypothetical protein
MGGITLVKHVRAGHLAAAAVLAAAVLVLSACGNPLLTAIEQAVATAKDNIVASDEIVVTVGYKGVYVLDADHPIWLMFYPAPFSGDSDTDPSIKSFELTDPGKVRVKKSQLGDSSTGEYFLLVMHDMNGNFASNKIIDGGDTSALFVNNGGDNITYDGSSLMVST